MDVKQIDDHIFEALFRQAVIDEYTEEIDSIPSKSELMKKISFSMEFELRMKKLLVREQRKESLEKFIRFGKRAAAVFVVLTSILFCTMLLNYEVRAAVKNTIVEWYDKFTSFIFQAETSDADKQKEWRPKYLPPGYNEISIEMLGKVTNIEYFNNEGDVIHFSYKPQGNVNISIDNENHTIEINTVNGYEAYTAESEEDGFENGIIWSMDEYTFSIWSKLPLENIIEIAESVSDNK